MYPSRVIRKDGPIHMQDHQRSVSYMRARDEWFYADADAGPIIVVQTPISLATESVARYYCR